MSIYSFLPVLAASMFMAKADDGKVGQSTAKKTAAKPASEPQVPAFDPVTPGGDPTLARPDPKGPNAELLAPGEQQRTTQVIDYDGPAQKIPLSAATTPLIVATLNKLVHKTNAKSAYAANLSGAEAVTEEEYNEMHREAFEKHYAEANRPAKKKK